MKVLKRTFSMSCTCAIINCTNEVTIFDIDPEPFHTRAKGLFNESLDLCESHYNQYIRFYTLRRKYCCNTKAHESKIVKGLRVIDDKFARKYGLIPGDKICKTCMTKFKKNYEIPSSSSEEESEKSDIGEVEIHSECSDDEVANVDSEKNEDNFTTKFLGNFKQIFSISSGNKS